MTSTARMSGESMSRLARDKDACCGCGCSFVARTFCANATNAAAFAWNANGQTSAEGTPAPPMPRVPHAGRHRTSSNQRSPEPCSADRAVAHQTVGGLVFSFSGWSVANAARRTEALSARPRCAWSFVRQASGETYTNAPHKDGVVGEEQCRRRELESGKQFSGHPRNGPRSGSCACYGNRYAGRLRSGLGAASSLCISGNTALSAVYACADVSGSFRSGLPV